MDGDEFYEWYCLCSDEEGIEFNAISQDSNNMKEKQEEDDKKDLSHEINANDNECNCSINPSNNKSGDQSVSAFAQFFLQDWLIKHREYPYMKNEYKKKYSKILNISTAQITAYLNEKRKKVLSQIEN